MQIQKTDKTILTPDDILKYISDYEMAQVKEFDTLWNYYKGQNEKVLARTVPSQNDPNNKVPIPYGKKIVTTYTGYAHKPHSTTYQAVDDKSEDEEIESEEMIPVEANPDGTENELIIKPKPKTIEQQFCDELISNFNLNNEHIKTSRAGRNTGIFGVAYELLYMDGAVNNDIKTNASLPVKAEPRFFSVDPREMILLYDYQSEPKKIMAIRFYRITDDHYKVELYYKDKIVLYDRKKQQDPTSGTMKWVLILLSESINFYGDIPVIAYYFGDEMLGLIKPVIPIIDAYDTIIADSMNEYDKFADAYLIMKNFGITEAAKRKDPNAFSQAIASLKRKRAFENIPKDAEVSYLTKDIPTSFVDFMSKKLKDEIHTQSHVPDFKDMATGSLSGAAIQRMLFDFENVVSSAEADFDTALKERIRLIGIAFEKLRRFTGGTPDMISISHRRNLPADLKEKAETAQVMKNAGFSRWLCADIMPDDVIPDVEEELRRQDEDAAGKPEDIEDIPEPEEPIEEAEQGSDNMANMNAANNKTKKTQIGEKK
jgi:SPP1 family phage portal protein